MSEINIKKILLSPFVFTDYILDRCIAVIGAVTLAQFPQFIAQYMQRLGGHVDELSRIVSQYTNAAKDSGKTLQEYIQIHVKSTTPDFVNTGKIMSKNIDRLHDLNTTLNDISSASGFNKFFSFIKGLDGKIFNGTMDNYTPGIPTTFEGAVYAAIGVITGILLYKGLKKGFGAIFKKLFGKKNKGGPGNPPVQSGNDFYMRPGNNF